MRNPALRLLAGLFIAAGSAGLLAQDSGVESAAPAAPLVLSAEVDSIIHPVSAEYMIATMVRADAEGAALVVFTLRTPGGLVDSTRQIITAMLAARTPVVMFVAPSGARAASAGFILMVAADVAAMAPGTHIGAAHPVSGDGQVMDEVMAKKAASDVAAYVRTLAEKRGRNVVLAEEAVNDSRAFTDSEALAADPPLIDLQATDLTDLLTKLDGRAVVRFDGTTTVLGTAGARVVQVEMNWRERLLSAIANPNIAYILLSLGTLGLTIELWSPGAILPGVVGGLSLLLAFFALQILPVNYVGVLLIVFGLVLLVLEVKVASFGLLAAGGLVSLILGSMMLIDSPAPELRVSLQVIVPITLSLAAITVFLVRLAVAAQLQPTLTGSAGMLNDVGEALAAFEPGRDGQVRAHGEIWRARAAEPIAQGDRVRVTAVDGLVLTVRRDGPSPLSS
jgi:membrane-bound serine protease (ClpP class)